MSDKKDEVVEVEKPDYLGMSDEDILKMGAPVIPPVVKDEKKDPVDEDVEDAATDDEVDGEKDEGDDDDKPAGDSKAAKSEEAKDADEVKDGEKTPDPKAKAPEEKVKEDGEKKEPEAKKATEPAPIDYEAEYKRLLAPFKANGKEVKVDSVEDAVALMQMGANYNKQMAALKPVRKLMKMLENNGFLSEEKIGFLIDLGKKDPAAINKLVKDSGIDPMDLDAAKADAYKQKTFAASDTEVELDTVLDELSSSPTYTRTLEVVSKKWDAASKQVVSEHPQLLKLMDSHMASGIYDLISAEVEKEQMLGRLSGLSSLEAYRRVGDAINARKGFDHLNKAKSNPKEPPDVIPAKEKAPEDDKLKEKRRAAGSTKPAATPVPPANFSPLAMTDEEFLKQAAPKFK